MPMKRSTLPLVRGRYGWHSRGRKPLGIVEEAWMKAVYAAPIGIPFEDDRLLFLRLQHRPLSDGGTT